MEKEKALSPPILDVRDVAPGQRHSKILQLFNQLSAGDAFTFVNNHNPKPLLYQLQIEQETTFEWWPLEEGPDEWRIQIAKRTQQSGGDRTITDFLQTDHARLDSIFSRFAKLVDNLQVQTARQPLKEFAVGLRRHIRMEEEFLFPAVQDYTGGPAGPTRVMRLEHEEIESMLSAIEQEMETAARNPTEVSPNQLHQVAHHLLQALRSHNEKEEQILYPLSDRAYASTERADLIRRMQAL